jgi:hypothetical protein
MTKIRAILVGSLIWLMIFSTFTVLSYIPNIKDSALQQFLIVALLAIPFTILGASIFYKNRNKANGFLIGLIIVITALTLDVLITVPFTIIPNQGTYHSFFTSKFLWILVAEVVTIVYFYWKLKIKTKLQNI